VRRWRRALRGIIRINEVFLQEVLGCPRVLSPGFPARLHARGLQAPARPGRQPFLLSCGARVRWRLLQRMPGLLLRVVRRAMLARGQCVSAPGAFRGHAPCDTGGGFAR
jgi:hypothetical protein